jgi:hypothetical protein
VSYDIWLEHDGNALALLDWNYTSNCAPMWRLAMPSTDGLAGMHEMKASDAAEALRAGIAAMEADSEPYRELNPSNGWGDFDGQLEALRRLLAAFEQAPNATVAIWR